MEKYMGDEDETDHTINGGSRFESDIDEHETREDRTQRRKH